MNMRSNKKVEQNNTTLKLNFTLEYMHAEYDI